MAERESDSVFFTSMIQFLNSEIETTTTNREREEPSVELQHIQALKETVHEEQELTNELYEESGRFEALYLQLRNLVDRLQVAPNNSREEDMILQTINEKRKEIREVMLLSGAWNEILVMPEFDLDKAVAAAKAVGTYAMPGKE